MKNTHITIALLLLLSSDVIFACDSGDGKYRKFSIGSDQYETKPDMSKQPKSNVLGKKAYPKLYCLSSNGNKCTEESIWLSSKEFAKHLVGYKVVHCQMESRTVSIKSGVKTDLTKFIVYYEEK
jgi:hypothetical protein